MKRIEYVESVIAGIFLLGSLVLMYLSLVLAIESNLQASVIVLGEAPPLGLEAYYPFDNDANDASGNNNNGTIYGASFVPGKTGSAISFDGNDYVNVRNKVFSPTSINTEDFSVSFWIKPSNSLSSNYVLSKRKPSQPTLYLRAYKVETRLISGNNVNIGSGYNQGPKPNQWTHIALVCKRGEQGEYYKNGVKQATRYNLCSQGDISNNGDFYIGRYYSSYFRGALDELRIYEKALTGQEVYDLYTGQLPEPVCGNNIKESGELCDGQDLGGQSCVSQGFDAGTLSCLSNCSGFDLTGCYNAECTDNDNDGYNIEGGVCGLVDCNDNNNLIYPNAPENCDNADNNCNSLVDENLIRSCGSGLCAGQQSCSNGFWGNCDSQERDAGTCALCDSNGQAIYDSAQNQDCSITLCPMDSCGTDNCGVNIFADYPDFVQNYCSEIYTCTQNTCENTAVCESDNDADNYSSSCGDCNDNNATINPNALEVECNGIDEDCNGLDYCPGTLDLEAYYPFDNNANDASGNNNNGTIYGASFVPGKTGSAISFDGNDYVNVRNKVFSPTSINTEDFSVSFWIKPSNSLSSNYVLSKRNYGEGAMYVRAYKGEARVIADSLVNIASSYNQGPEANQWTHIALVCKRGEQGEYYKNGVKQVTRYNLCSQGDISNNGDFYIGRYYSSYFRGALDELRIYSQALTGQEVLNEYLSA